MSRDLRMYARKLLNKVNESDFKIFPRFPVIFSSFETTKNLSPQTSFYLKKKQFSVKTQGE